MYGKHGSARGAHDGPRAGKKKQMSGAMLPKKSLGHYEAHARGVHKLDTHMPGAPHSESVRHGTATAKGDWYRPPMPNPKMGGGRRGGY